MSSDFDVCIIGSGAGGGPIAYALTKAGHSVVMLEKGPWFKTDDFTKDEIAVSRRSTFTPNLSLEPQVVETEAGPKGWSAQSTYQSGWNFWNGNCVGGSTNFMSGYFYRLKPTDFKLLSTFGPIEGADIVDWPISYEDLKPYYDKVEKLVGVSGKDSHYPPTVSHPVSKWIEDAAKKLNLTTSKTPRAILPYSDRERGGCTYSGYCGGYGCASDAKGSPRASLIADALKTERLDLRPNSMVSKLISNKKSKVIAVEYFNKQGHVKRVDAKIFVIACQAIESARLLLLSKDSGHPQGLANSSGLVGKNLLFAGGGAASARFPYSDLSIKKREELKEFGTFLNIGIDDRYTINDKSFGKNKAKGGIVNFLFPSAAPISKASSQINGKNKLVWGKKLQKRLHNHFTKERFLKIEAFGDWLPHKDCFIKLDDTIKDHWGLPVSRVRPGFHIHNLNVGWYLASQGAKVFKTMGGRNIVPFASGGPPTNLVAGTCRFGNDPTKSVLNKDCRAHDVENLYITDGSFMPTGGSVPYTFTIYANSFRVADIIISKFSSKNYLSS